MLWFGAKRGCGEELRTQKPIIWNHDGKFKLLGIEFEVNSDDTTCISINFNKKKMNLFKNFSTIGHLDHFHFLVKFV